MRVIEATLDIHVYSCRLVGEAQCIILQGPTCILRLAACV